MRQFSSITGEITFSTSGARKQVALSGMILEALVKVMIKTYV